MESRRATDRKRSEGGIALFMVIAAVAVLSILVTEFTYIAQVNQKMAFDGLDQLKAHYLAKSGLKLSLLRLKAYQNVKDAMGKLGGGKSGDALGVPRQALEKIWNFPFFYPIPTEIPGLSLQDRDAIEKFQKASGLEGRFSAIIESESGKYNLNLMLAPFAPPAPSPSPSPSPPPSGGAAPPAGVTGPTGPAFNAAEARKSLSEYLGELFRARAEGDADFAAEYRDLNFDELMDNIFAWADPLYEKQFTGMRDQTAYKKGPFYSLSELHQIPGMDDGLFELFAPALTVSTTPGINVNTLKEPTLRALLPGITDEEVKDFFTFRDSEEEDNQFKDAEKFFEYVQRNISVFRNSPTEVERFKESLKKRNVRIVVDETLFKITVQASVNQSTRLIEAWVTLGSTRKSKTPPSARPPAGTPPFTGEQTPSSEAAQDPGLKITFMRVL
ncbi:MAG: type II secretion system protein GspK [Oligoflexia bacterium]|nr:type II secretion system protein GspK [Oligoflexia bacterium]